MNLTLSPTLHAICMRSANYRRHFRFDALNVCNVIRSFLFVLLFKTALVTLGGFMVAHAFFQIPFVMYLTGNIDPIDAINWVFEYHAVYGKEISWISVFFGISNLFSGFIWTVCLGIAIFALVCVSVIMAARYIPDAKKHVAAAKVAKVLTPVTLVAEYIESKHSKFCVNVQAKVNHRVTAKQLEADAWRELRDYEYLLKCMTTPELLASIERNRSILMKHVKP